MNFRVALAASALALSACSGGGGAGIPASPSGGGSGGAITDPSKWPSSAKMTFSFRPGYPVSSGEKRPAYISPSTTQVVISVNTVNGGAPPSWVPTPVTAALDFGGSGNCTLSGGTATCSIAVPAPPGTVNYTVSAESATDAVLSTWTGDQTVVQGVNNSLSATLEGVVASVALYHAGPPLVAGTSDNSYSLTLTARDAMGNAIVAPGAFSNPLTLTDEDATLQTMLSVNGGALATSVVVDSPDDVVTLSYTGQATNAFTIGVSGTGVTGSGSISTSVDDVVLTGTTLDDAAHGGLATDANWGQQTVFFAEASGMQTIGATEVGWTGAPYLGKFDATLSSACTTGNIASISAGPGTSFTITATGTEGVCSGRLTEHGTGYPITGHAANAPGSATHDGTFWVSVTSASFGINGTHGR